MRDKKANAVACSIFKKEIEKLISSGRLDCDFTFIDSDLHMKPAVLDQVLRKLIHADCLLCYGDCHARMIEQEKSGLVTRVEGLNCVEIFLGRERYRKLRKEGAFFLLPEWTKKWKHVFIELLGFKDQEVARQFMNEMHKKMIYVDTGAYEIPIQTLQDISAYFSLPVEVIEIDLINLEIAIKNGVKRIQDES